MEDQLQQFEEWYDAHADAIFRHLYLRLGDRERAKELTQEVFTRTWQHLAAHKKIEYPKAFLYRIAHNLFVNEIRTDKRTRSLDILSEETGFEVLDQQADATLLARQRELMAYLDGLKDSYRQVLILRYIDELPVKEIAALLEETETNISMRIKRALGQLRDIYHQSPDTNL